MILKFLEHFHLREFQQLDEKLIIVGKGKRYGQIMFLAGGAGSGKGFAIKNFLEGDKFKVRDVDEWKKALMKIGELKKKWPEIKGLNLRKPNDVARLHMFVKEKGIKDKTLDRMLGDAIRSGSAKKGTLPNILFDITLKEIGDIKEVLPSLMEAGYDSKNMHLTWVLTNYHVAVQNNATRERVVPSDILLQTHEGAAKTMVDIIRGKTPSGVDGAVNVILNNRENTIAFKDAAGNTIKRKKRYATPDEKKKKEDETIVVKDFTYLNMKREGKKFNNEAAVQKQLFSWISKNVPASALDTIKEPEL